MKRKYYFSALLILIQLAMGIYMGFQLPDEARIPSHWNLQGEVDGYMDKWPGLLIFPGFNLLIFILMLVLPYISVRYRQAPERFEQIIPRVTNILVSCFFLMNLGLLLVMRGVIAMSNLIVFLPLGILFYLLGNVMPQLPSNFFVGIRTPWTLSSESNWVHTHQLGSLCFRVSGILLIIIPALFKNKAAITELFLIFIFLIILYPVLYSFLLFRKEKKQEN